MASVYLRSCLRRVTIFFSRRADFFLVVFTLRCSLAFFSVSRRLLSFRFFRLFSRLVVAGLGVVKGEVIVYSIIYFF